MSLTYFDVPFLELFILGSMLCCSFAGLRVFTINLSKLFLFAIYTTVTRNSLGRLCATR